MPDLVLAADLGTSGCKSALYDIDGGRVASAYIPYATRSPFASYREQRPADWWRAFLRSARSVVDTAGAAAADVATIAISGQSLALLPLDSRGRLLLRDVPIWSDARAEAQARLLFGRIPEAQWYGLTGSGFPPPLYTVFKAMWLREAQPGLFARTAHIVGSKDYLNYRMTGEIATDHSYASGSGIYDIDKRAYDSRVLEAAELPRSIWPEIQPASAVVGRLTATVARQLGVRAAIPVTTGGVDNACMTLGARGTVAGRIFGSLGSSDWITVTSPSPILDFDGRSYVFDHVVPGLYVSAQSTFGGGTSLAWIGSLLGPRQGRTLSHDALADLASESSPGANGLLCIPILAGGTVAEGGPDVRGALVGLDARHTRADVARAFFEGASLALRAAMDRMRVHAGSEEPLLVVGGGSRSTPWLRILSDVLHVSIVTSTVDQQAATLGAAAVGWVALGGWSTYEQADRSHSDVLRLDPQPESAALYDDLFAAYRHALDDQRRLAGRLTALRDR